MAASFSSSSSASKEYDVFLSFRGEDTRCNFTSHLVSALSRNSIRAYIDYELNKGDEISPTLIKAIHNSYGSLIVFSENYAFSKWCLNELLEILEHRKRGHFVVPVFYNVDPSHVRKQTGSYGEAFGKHKLDSKNKEKLQLWKAALTEAANIVGWDSQSRTNRDESELIQSIVNDILQKMDYVYQPRESSFVGIEKYCQDIESLLQRTLLVGIWGIGGIGKTTIAKAVFDKLFSQYDSSCFFENIREETERNGLNYMRDKLLTELLKDENFHSSTPKTPAFKFTMRRLGSKKVLIVLDDVSSSKQVEFLQQECKCLRADSKVIITTRDKHVVNGFRVCYEIYKVEGLNFEESLHLFRLNAFNESYPGAEYEEITKKVVNYAKGNPLALKVLGSFLFSKSKKEWESALAKLKKIPNDDIQKVLRLSYDGLDDIEKQIFLEVACFLKGEYIDDVISLLDSYDLFGHIGMRTLLDKALVTILNDKRVHMHDLLQEMGQNIVHKECTQNPEKHTRLWDTEEIYDVLKNDKGIDTIEGIKLNLSQIKDLSLKMDTFKKMTNIRFLKFYSSNFKSCKVDLPASIELPSKKLSYLHWDMYPLLSLPTNFCPEKLVKLQMPYSNITKLWDGRQDIVNLKEINLFECAQLMELPDFSKASKLERAVLDGCSNLCHIHPSLLHLDTLVVLDVTNCEKLTGLESDKHLKSLKTISIGGCSSLKKFSLSSEKIEYLYFYGTAVEKLPSSLVRCKNLKDLQFGYPLKKIPSELCKLTSVQSLVIRGAGEFDSSELPTLFDALNPSNLYLTNCDKLLQLPHNISMMSSLKHLSLRGSSVESLPETIKHLSCLKRLDVGNCQRLRSLPELPPSIECLLARNCSILETLIPSTSLEQFDLKNCVKLDEQTFCCITAYAHYRIKRVEPTQVCFPGDRTLRWFNHRTMQTMISIELPPRASLLGFVFSLYISHKLIPSNTPQSLCIGCNCYLEYSATEKSLIGECKAWYGYNSYEGEEFNSDDVYMKIYKCDRNSFSEISETGANRSVSFEFYAYSDSNELDLMIKECGVWPIYVADFELELGTNSNRGEMESFEHQRIEVGGLDHEIQDECKMLNDNNEVFDFFGELELRDRCRSFGVHRKWMSNNNSIYQRKPRNLFRNTFQRN